MTVAYLGWHRSEQNLTICANDGRAIVRITRDGKVIVNPDFTIDEAARAFWEAVQKLAAKEK
ncbi:MAG TPA: hypothetical protein VE030_11030 [Burkholderiales bacterium]|nr:hypothetical protein [Burkholderiales bacterium]